MSKRIKKRHAKDHLGDMKMTFLASVVSGVDTHLSTPRGTVMFARLNDKKKNDRFRNHILDEFAKRSVNTLDNIEHDEVFYAAEKFQGRYLNAATREVNRIEKHGEDFDHNELLMRTFAAFDKLHDKLIEKL